MTTSDDAPDLMTIEGRERALAILADLRRDERRKTAALCLALRTLTEECGRHDVSIEMNMMLAGFSDERVEEEIERMHERPVVLPDQRSRWQRLVDRLFRRDC